MDREASGIRTLVIGVDQGCCIDPALMQAICRASLAIACRSNAVTGGMALALGFYLMY